jgi:8-oxo-dGTP pyrophosphatase MutT (NUDIX family)
MAHAWLVLRRSALGDEEVLLAQRNLFLQPTDRYEWAAIARHAVQYVFPGGKVEHGEEPLDAAVRELYEDSGFEVPRPTVRPLTAIGDEWFFEAVAPLAFEIGRANAALAQGSARSAKTNNFAWVPLDGAATWLGLKPESQHLPWVTAQVQRAVAAGFGREHIAPRVADSHAAFEQALRMIRGLGGTLQMRPIR